MSDALIVRLGGAPEDGADWALIRDGAITDSGRCADGDTLIAQLNKFDDTARLFAMLPGEQVAMRMVPNPPRSPSKFVAAARLLLEDELATALDECHIATQLGEASGKAFALREDLARRWVSFFSEAGRPLNHLTVDFECLGGGQTRPIIFIEEERIIASFGGLGFATDKDLALRALESLQADQPDVVAGVYVGPTLSPAFDDPHYDRLGAGDSATLMALAAQAFEAGAAVNLLQGALKPRRRRIIDRARWRRPALAAGLLLAIGVAALLADGWRTGSIAARYASEAQRIHDESFPAAKGADPRAHARRVLTGKSVTSFIAASNALDRALAGNDAVTIDRLRFDGERGELSFAIRSASDADIEAFRKTLSGYGIEAGETTGYRRSGAFWIGELTARL